MKPLILVKSAVAIMTLIIITGFAFVLFKISEKSIQNKPKHSSSVIENVLRPAAGAPHAFGCSEYVCVASSLVDGTIEIVVMNPKTGSLENKITLK